MSLNSHNHYNSSKRHQVCLSSSAVVWPPTTLCRYICWTEKAAQYLTHIPQTPWSFRLPSLPQPCYALTPSVAHLATSAKRPQIPLLTPQVRGLFPSCCLSLGDDPPGQFLSLSWQSWDHWQQNMPALSPTRASFQLSPAYPLFRWQGTQTQHTQHTFKPCLFLIFFSNWLRKCVILSMTPREH